MSERVIPLVDQRLVSRAALVPQTPIEATGLLGDSLGRPLRDLRISVTDRCNFRCNYCMPKSIFDKDYPYLPHSALLSFEEITRIARQFVAHGVQKIRLTGGEPLLRKNLEILIEQLAALRTVEGHPLDITLTTNGSLLERKARDLKAAGLQRVTVSLDGLDDAVFRAMNDVDFPVAKALASFTMCGGMISRYPAAMAWSRKKLINARCNFAPCPLYTGKPAPVTFTPRSMCRKPYSSPSSQCGFAPA